MNWSLTPKVQGDVAAWFGSLPVVPQGCKASALLGDKGCETNGYNEFTKSISGKRRLPKAGNTCPTAAGRRITSRWAAVKAGGRHDVRGRVSECFAPVWRCAGGGWGQHGIRDGEFFSMLGPSGSGKTTCLRLIAGFEQLSGGTILFSVSRPANCRPGSGT
jgi:hypothetical protein